MNSHLTWNQRKGSNKLLQPLNVRTPHSQSHSLQNLRCAEIDSKFFEKSKLYSYEIVPSHLRAAFIISGYRM